MKLIMMMSLHFRGIALELLLGRRVEVGLKPALEHAGGGPNFDRFGTGGRPPTLAHPTRLAERDMLLRRLQ